MKKIFNPDFIPVKNEILHCIINFDSTGENLSLGQRNTIKLFHLESFILNVKSFKKPNFINQIAYGFFRKSKAQRSFEYATTLTKLGIGTPTPIAYFENSPVLGLTTSFYACEHLENVFEFREVIENENFKNREELIRQFTRFTISMQDKGVEFLDHSPGNTLIRANENGSYSFYLVDLNRMNFHEKLDFNTRMKNLSKITHKKEMVVTMSNEYACITGENENLVFESLWKLTETFQYKYYRKKRLKKKFLFWKK